MSNHPSYLDDIIIFLMAAVAVVLLFRKLKASPVLGYLVAGIVAGPHGIGLIGHVENTRVLGEFGVVFLLFTIGLELPIQRLYALRQYVFGLGFLQFIVTGALIGLVVYYGGFDPEASLLLGGALALSSTAVVIQVLSERGELATRFGRVSFSILLFQDLAVVVILVLLSILDNGGGSLSRVIGAALVKAALAFTLIILIGRYLLRPLFRIVAQSRNADLFMVTTLIIVLGTSLITAEAGLSMELGAFLAGVLLSETEYRHQVEADIQPFRGLLLGVFFMTVGMTIDTKVLFTEAPKVLFLISLYLTIKIFCTFSLCRLFRLSTTTAFRTSLLLATGGEFVFVIFSPHIISEIMSEKQADLLFVVVALSMALTPIFASFGRKIAESKVEKEHGAQVKETQKETADFKNHVILAGFGRVGQMVGDILAKRLIPFVAVDNDMARVTEARKKGLPVFFGDARRLEVIRALGGERASAVVLTLNHPNSSIKSVMMLRRNFPELDISVRIRDQEHAAKVEGENVHLVIPEAIEPSLQLASSVLKVLGTPHEEVDSTINAFRRSQLSPLSIKR